MRCLQTLTGALPDELKFQARLTRSDRSVMLLPWVRPTRQPPPSWGP